MNPRAALPLLFCGIVAASAVAVPALAQPRSPEGTIRVALRTQTIEALPLLVALSAGADSELGVRPELVDVGNGNPVVSLGAGMDAAVGTSVDRLAADRPDVVDAFNFFGRAPVAIVAHTPSGDRSLGGRVIAAPDSEDLAARLARSLAEGPYPPRLVPGSDWFSILGSYSAGQLDGVLAMAPLPQYLATHQGTVVWDATSDADSPPIGAGSLFLSSEMEEPTRERLVALMQRGTQLLATMPDAEVVDLVADRYLVWEPDAVLEAARVAKRCLNPTGQLSPAALERAGELLRLGSAG